MIFNMEQERVNEPEKAEIVHIEYEQPKLVHRVLANFLDVLLMVACTILCFIASRAIVTSTPMYRDNDYALREIQLSSGLYINADRTSDSPVDERGFDINEYRYGDEVMLYTIWLTRQDSLTYEAIVNRCEKAIDKFVSYINSVCHHPETELMIFLGEEKLNKVGDVPDHEHFFIRNVDTNSIEIPLDENGRPYYSYQTYFKEFYKKLMDDKLADDYLIKYVPKFKECLKNEGICLLFIELPSAYFVAALLVYFIPPLFFRRGRMTLGKALYRIGLVDKNILSPTFVKHLLRFVIFFFAELVLSIFTFGIPYVISFTLMLCSKKKQGFPDYMLGLTEIDSSKQKIYYNRVEALTDKASVYKAASDFKLPDNL